MLVVNIFFASTGFKWFEVSLGHKQYSFSQFYYSWFNYNMQSGKDLMRGVIVVMTSLLQFTVKNI